MLTTPAPFVPNTDAAQVGGAFEVDFPDDPEDEEARTQTRRRV